MKLTKLAEELKTELLLELAKQGSTPWDFERALGQINTSEGVLKVATELNLLQDYLVNPGARALQSIPGLAMNASAGAGAAAGMTFDELEKGVLDLNHSLDRERQKVHMIRRLTDNLKKEHGIN